VSTKSGQAQTLPSWSCTTEYCTTVPEVESRTPSRSSTPLPQVYCQSTVPPESVSKATLGPVVDEPGVGDGVTA
jgi:hypothetical protein